MKKSICVFCSSSDRAPEMYFEAARELGSAIAGRGFSLVYGGAKVGLMRTLADAVLAGDAHVTGVIPESIRNLGIVHDSLTELHVTVDLRTRKAKMELLADAFVALPGGFGTLEEVAEILTLKQLGLHNKPIVFVNIAGHFDPLISYFDRMISDRFAREDIRQLYFMADGVNAALDHIASYEAKPIPPKIV